MNLPTVSHVGIAVKDLDAAIRQYTLLLGSPPIRVEEVPDQKVRVAIFDNGVAGGRVELMTPTSPDSPISRFLERRGEGLHHVCVYVEDIEKKLAELKAAGLRLVDDKPRIGAEGHRIAFVHPSGLNGVLLELEERSE